MTDVIVKNSVKQFNYLDELMFVTKHRMDLLLSLIRRKIVKTDGSQ